MGGEWDSTNVADGDVAVFTPIGIDHSDRLGNTITEIATTKAGIIKPASIVVSAPQPEAARQVLIERASSVADAWAEAGVNYEVLECHQEGFGQRFSVRSLAATYQDLFIPLLGVHQVENAALAIAAIEAFMGGGNQPINQDFLRSAMADATSPGRLQVISREPLVILDAAHNPHGAKSLAQSLVDNFGAPYTVAVLGVLADKDATGIFEALDDVVTGVVITQSSSTRAIPADELGSIASQVFGADRITVIANPIEALAAAQEMLPNDFKAAVVVAGSISLVGDVLAAHQADVDMQADLDDDWQPEYEVQEIYQEEEDGSEDA
jgi:dihydrofolate synthase/folylpolyglutamate synthase